MHLCGFRSFFVYFFHLVVLIESKILPEKYEALEIVEKTPREILELRGFLSEEHFAHTPDGYYIHLDRIVNPNINTTLKRPVIFNHGFLESPTIWLMNSRDTRATSYNGTCEIYKPDSSDSAFPDMRNSIPMLLSNCAYDVWLMSMRGTDLSQGHDYLTTQDSEFWDFSLDDFGLIDVPTVVDYIRSLTGAKKVGYVGHSQATFTIFALLSVQPFYANFIEPVIAIAPVTYKDPTYFITKPVSLMLTGLDILNKNRPFPPAAHLFRLGLFKFCNQKLLALASVPICQLTERLIAGLGRNFLNGFFNHLPFYSSAKVVRHFAQLINSRRFQMYDYMSDNIKVYGRKEAPEYPVEKIQSRSLCLVYAKTDSLAKVEDVELLKKRFTVPVYRNIMINRKYNHIDMLTDPSSNELVFQPILEIFESFKSKKKN